MGIRVSGRPYNAQRRKANAPSDQGSVPSTARPSKDGPNRPERGGKAPTAKVEEGRVKISLDRTENPARGPEWTQPVSDDVATGTHGVIGPRSLLYRYPAAQRDRFTRAAMCLPRNPIAERRSLWTTPTGREPTADGGHNPPVRRAVCEQHSYGSVRAGGGKPPLATRQEATKPATRSGAGPPAKRSGQMSPRRRHPRLRGRSPPLRRGEGPKGTGR